MQKQQLSQQFPQKWLLNKRDFRAFQNRKALTGREKTLHGQMQHLQLQYERLLCPRHVFFSLGGVYAIIFFCGCVCENFAKQILLENPLGPWCSEDLPRTWPWRALKLWALTSFGESSPEHRPKIRVHKSSAPQRITGCKQTWFHLMRVISQKK